MNYYSFILSVFIFSSALARAGILVDYNRPYISNAFAIAEKAAASESVSNYIQAVQLYSYAKNRLGDLIARGAVQLDQGKPHIEAWQKKINLLQPRASHDLYLLYAREYGTQINALYLAIASNDVTGVSIAFHKCTSLYPKLSGIYTQQPVPDDLPVMNPIQDVRSMYDAYMKSYYDEWVVRRKFTDAQKSFVRKVSTATSLVYHVAVLDAARTNSVNAVSLPWLEMVYRDLALMNPTDYAFWYGLGNCLSFQNNITGANYAWHDALKYFPDSFYFHYHLARTCSAVPEDATRAIAHLKWCLINTDNSIWSSKIYHQMALRFLQLNDLTNAYLNAERAAAQVQYDLSPEAKQLFVEAKKVKCSSLLRQGRSDAALIALEEAVLSDPDNLPLKSELADLYAALSVSGDDVDEEYCRQALMWYDSILRDYPATPAAHAGKAFLYLKLGDIERAQSEAIQELSIVPDSVNGLTTLGFARLAQNKFDQARVLFKKALQFDPECQAAIRGLNTIDASQPAPLPP